ncbi:hypothetical protein BgAZ_400070 [Babesia gibsoni]|uniref:U3 small nucleolar RNA-associated protein 20 domain-containing protein n=1 Tax=Babesia gibsoni TaxID=33632 RepID=A0AAD8PD94_BABGI|nr:hypothetical protein BgAZ_400070 [Babesia gibsoni]
MTNPGKFKFVSASKKSRSLSATAFKDIGLIIGSDGPVEERRFFIQNLRNTLRSKDLVKHKQALKDILHRYEVLEEESFAGTVAFTEWSKFVISSLLSCADSANNLELRAICKLLAIFFKDYGNQSFVVAPLGELLRILEKNPDGNAEAIFSLISTHFSLNSRYMKDDINEVLSEFTPWLKHKHKLIRRLSMESLSLLLRRQPETRSFPVICRLLCLEGSEHLLFGIIKNVQGAVTTKMQPLFKHLLKSISQCSFKPPEGMDALMANVAVSRAVRHCLFMLVHHCKAKPPDIEWLDTVYEELIGALKDSNLHFTTVASYSVAAELAVEMFCSFTKSKDFKIKDMPLMKEGQAFDAMLSHFLIPLLSFAKESSPGRHSLFDEICQLLVRIVRASCEATDVLSNRFSDVLHQLLHFIKDAPNTNHLMVLLEWRLKGDNLIHISHFLLVISTLLDSKDIFHPVFINPMVNSKIVECIKSSLDTLAGCDRNTLSKESLFECYYHNMSIIFGCLNGLSSISSLRMKMKAPPIILEKALLENILKECFVSFKDMEDSRLTVEVVLICIRFMDKSEHSFWIDSLVDVVKCTPSLLLNSRLLNELICNFNKSMCPLAQQIVDMLPDFRCDFRKASLGFFMRLFEDKGIELSPLRTLLDMESLEVTLDNERKKALLMTKCVEALQPNIGTTDEQQLLLSVISKVLLSQFYVKYSPIWEAASDTYEKLVLKIVNDFKGNMAAFRHSVLESMWKESFTLIETKKEKPMEYEGLPDFVVSFIPNNSYEYTDQVTMQRELLRLITRIVSHRDNKPQCIQALSSYTYSQMIEESKKDFRKHALVALSMVLQKYKTHGILEELVDICIRDGISSNDPVIREACLIIISRKHTGIDMKRLQVVATAPDQRVIHDDADGLYENIEDIESREISIGIEIRMFVPRILQHSKQMHGKGILEYMSRWQPRYLTLVILELIPSRFSKLFYGSTKDDDAYFKRMMGVLGFNDSVTKKPPIQRAIRTIGVMVKRMKKNLSEQAIPLMQLCCSILTECTTKSSDQGEDINMDFNVESLITSTISLMVDLIKMFDTSFPNFLDVLANYSDLLAIMLEKHKDILPLIACLTERTEYLNKVCTELFSNGFHHLFNRKATPLVISIIEDIYCPQKGTTEHSKDSALVSALVVESGTVLDCIKYYKPVAANVIKGILYLPIDEAMRNMCLTIVMSNLTSLKALSLHKESGKSPNYDAFKSLRNLLDCMKICTPLITNKEKGYINRIWDFVNECLFYIGDITCRNTACTILSLLPVEEEGLEVVIKALLRMNETKSGSMDDRIDLEANCHELANLTNALKDHVAKPKVLYTALLHSLFLLLFGHKDPGVRRCVLNFTFTIMHLICKSLDNTSVSEPLNYQNTTTNCDYMDKSETPYVTLLFRGIFPFIQRCMSGLHSRESLFMVSVELLENFTKIFSQNVKCKVIFGTNLHGDLLCDEVAECLSNLRGVHKYNRNQGLKKLKDLISRADVFSNETVYRIVIPICMQFLFKSEAENYSLFGETSRDCLIACATHLPISSLFKFLKTLVETYQRRRNVTALETFSYIVRGIPAPEGPDKSSTLFSEDEDFERGQLLVQMFRRMLMRSQHNSEDLACPEVFEALGALLRHFSESVRASEIIKHSRLLGKSLSSRSRAARRYARTAIIKFVQCMGFCYIPLVIKELSSSLTRGFQLQVLIYTTHCMLSTLFKADQSLRLSRSDGIQSMLQMITSELVMRQERQDKKFKIDEGKHPKALILIELLGEFGDLDVCLSVCSYLWSILKGEWKMSSTEGFEYSVKFLNSVEHLISSAIRGFIANKHIDIYHLGNALFYGHLTYVRGMLSSIEKNLSADVLANYRLWENVSREALSRMLSYDNKTDSTNDGSADVNSVAISKREEHFMLYPGASTGRALKGKKRMGFDDGIIAPIFVNSALRLYSHHLSSTRNSLEKESNSSFFSCDDVYEKKSYDLSIVSVPLEATAQGILLCLISEDLKLQRPSASCLMYICDSDSSFVNLCGPILSEHLIDRLGSMQTFGSEDLAKDYVRLTCMMLRSDSNKLLFKAWERKGKSNDLVDGLLLQIESNLDRPGLQVPLLKLFCVLFQLHKETDNLSKSFYEVFNEIFVRMVKGNFTPSALRLSSRVVSQLLIVAPMEDNNRSKRFGMLLKHITSESGVVRIAVLECIHQFLKGISKKGAWKRHSEMVGIAIAMQMESESDMQCKLKMASVISTIWKDSSSDNKKDFLECVAHFLGKSSEHKEAVFAYILFHCISQETSLSWLKKSRILETCMGFLSSLEDDNSDHTKYRKLAWQAPYYWLRILDHLLQLPMGLEALMTSNENMELKDSTTLVMNKIWNYNKRTALASNHPWIRAASLRVLGRVMYNDSVYDKISREYGGNIYNIARSPLRLLSDESNMIERHLKLGLAVKESLMVMINQMLRITTKGDDNVGRVVASLCYSLRNGLGKPRQHYRRIDITLFLFEGFAKSTGAYKKHLRTPMLRVIIALTRAGACKPYYRIPAPKREGDEESYSSSVGISDRANEIISTIEAGFDLINAGSEYLKLLGFAREFVMQKKMLRKTKAKMMFHRKPKPAKNRLKGIKRRRE